MTHSPVAHVKGRYACVSASRLLLYSDVLKRVNRTLTIGCYAMSVPLVQGDKCLTYRQ